MVCIAAFIILAICVLTVPIIRLFNKKLAANIMSLFKKSTHCFSRRITLRKCDTSFKDDIKNSLLRKVVLKHPTWVKPLSALIELGSVLLILLTIWSLLVGTKALVSLYVYGTCNPSTPSSCSLDSSESCTIDTAPIEFSREPLRWIGNWFGEFGNAIKAIPTRMKNWRAEDYLPEVTSYYGGKQSGKPIALDIFDPGCIVCLNSFKAQKEAGFFDKYNVALMPYPIPSPETASGYKFQNSYLVTQYLLAVQLQPQIETKNPVAWQLVERMYIGKAPNGDGNQNAFNMAYDSHKAEQVLQDWLKDLGYNDEQIDNIAKAAKSDKVKQMIERNRQIVSDQIQTKKIPTVIFNGGRHDGGFDSKTKF